MPTFRLAEAEDAGVLANLVQRAYRGDEGWTTESELLADERIDEATVLKKTQDAETRVLVAVEGGRIVGCCEIVHLKNGDGYFGMFAVEPQLQTAGLGRKILQHAEKTAVAEWKVPRMEMTVIAQREQLIAWYERRGFTSTGETRPFPYDKLPEGTALRDDLHFAVLVKTL
ncbi:acyl-CoA N-acyltransferase [Mycena capillaripes]|nr:acyl-CoA N-acyltransferase [Mycena capillaripes]